MSHLESKTQKNLNLTIPTLNPSTEPQNIDNNGGSSRIKKVYGQQNGTSAGMGPEEQKRITLENLDSDPLLNESHRPPQTSTAINVNSLEDNDDHQSCNLSVNDRDSQQSGDL